MRTMAVASTAGRVVPGNTKIFMPTIPNSLMMRTSAIAFASGVRGLAPAATNSVRDDKIALKGQPSRRARGSKSLTALIGRCTFPTLIAIELALVAWQSR